MVAEPRVFTAALADRTRVADTLRSHLQSERDLAFAYLFGSFVGEPAFRDIDVGVSFIDLSPEAANLRARCLEAQLAPLLAYPLDVVVLNGRPVTFRFHVYRGQLLVVRDERQLESELEETMRIYFDIEPRPGRATAEAFAP